MNLKYYKNLDGIRAIAAIMVMVFHYFLNMKSDSFLLNGVIKLSVFGQTGVTLFFVLSGFLITRILLETKNTEGYFKNFYVRRALRIFPLYYLYLVITYYFIPILMGEPFPNFNQQLYYYTYLQNFAKTFGWNAEGPGHFWSLAVEEHFYLFWPFVIYFFSIKNITRIIYTVIIGAFLLRFFMVYEGYEVFYFTFTRFDSLAIGAFLAVLEKRSVFNLKNSKNFILLLAGLFIPTILMWTYFTGQGNNFIQVFKFLFLAVIYFALIGYLLCIKTDHFTNNILRSKFFSFTGKISYGLYVYHPLVYILCAQYLMIENIIFDISLRFALTYLIAFLSYQYFESSFLRLKKYFDYSRTKRLTSKVIASKS